MTVADGSTRAAAEILRVLNETRGVS
jgi:hypothetical protein